ncbi:hypothetical protein [Epilithonimonas caeni]|uniref:hypothetical protein n=1 Tax=Epilithonimonas caeni TaxID=365343 RepID=UPI00040DD7D1|nr:hypothetical protein [Epilithonimonas caeni]
MVSRNVLKKLSDNELEKYLKEDNRFVPEAVQIAFEILEERGRQFSDEYKLRIQEIIRKKNDSEEQKKNKEQEVWKDYFTEDPNAIRLFPRELILIIAVFLGTIPASILLGLNFIKLKKYLPALLTFILGFSFLLIQNLVVQFLYDTDSKNFYTYRKSPEFFVSALGALILFLFWVIFTPKKLPYRSASYIIPIVISLGMIALTIINPNGWFSTNFILSFGKGLKFLFS